MHRFLEGVAKVHAPPVQHLFGRFKMRSAQIRPILRFEEHVFGYELLETVLPGFG